MQLIFLRHGTRSFGIGDAPLNSEGLEEAEELSRHSALQEVTQIIASPKKRAQMTVTPLSTKIGLNIQTEPLLDQMHDRESEKDFVSRVKTFLDQLCDQGGLEDKYLLCSHSDWLSAAMKVLPTDDSDLSYHLFHCAEFLAFEESEGLWRRLKV